MRESRSTASAFRLATAALLAALAAGCGNQMFRQPSFSPLDTPRGAPPRDAVRVRTDLTPTDGRPVASNAWGDRDLAEATGQTVLGPAREPDLPPPNLSDLARYQAAPAAVDALKSPLPNDPRVVHAGNVLFLNRCVQCHNPTGHGFGTVGQYLMPHPPDLAGPLVQKISDGSMYWHITMGQGKMPGFRHWTTPTQRWALAAFVRSLGKPAATHLADTRQAPYPVYGLTGFEDGKSAYPFKTIGAFSGDPQNSPDRVNLGQGQDPKTVQAGK